MTTSSSARPGSLTKAADAGKTYVIFGKSSGLTNIDLSALAPGDGFVIQGNPGNKAGYSVASAGDVNGDGYDDLIVGAPKSDFGGSDSGAAYVIFGKAGGFTNINLNGLSRPRASSSAATMRATMRASASPRRATSTATAMTI